MSCNNDVVRITKKIWLQIWSYNLIHQSPKSCRSIGKTKWHPFKLIHTLSRNCECSDRFRILVQWYLQICWLQIHSWNEFGRPYGIQNSIHQWYWVQIFLGCLIYFSKLKRKSVLSIFFSWQLGSTNRNKFLLFPVLTFRLFHYLFSLLLYFMLCQVCLLQFCSYFWYLMSYYFF